MKSLIIFLLCCSVSLAQTTRVSPKRGGVPIPHSGDSSKVLTVVSSDTTVVPAWRTAAGGGGGTLKQWLTSRVMPGTSSFNQGTTHYVPVDWPSGIGWAGAMSGDNGADTTNNEVAGASYFPVGGTLKNFYFYGNAPGAGETFTVTVMINTTAQSGTYTVSNTDVDGTGNNGRKSDLTHTVTVPAGALVTYRIVTSATSNAFNGVMVCEFDSN